MKTRSSLASIRYPLGSFGLLLVVLVGRLADHAYPSNSAHYGRITPFLARRAIDGIAVVGWTIDRLGDWMSRGSASDPKAAYRRKERSTASCGSTDTG